ncbi:hypothetical protein [Halomonas sp.]|uniref:hypothetical protein n=1 Tax=Halomonas sp. TaxID=1486246 RepID=UPI003565D37E
MQNQQDTIATLEENRSHLFDAEALLLFLQKRENLSLILEGESPEVMLGALIDKAASHVSHTTGETTRLIESLAPAKHLRAS